MKDRLKIILIGESDSGKTNLIQRYVNNQYREGKCATIGVDFKIFDFDFSDEKIQIELWDTSGQGRFRIITKPFIKGKDIIILVYSVDDRESFEEIKKYWLPEAKKECRKDGK